MSAVFAAGSEATTEVDDVAIVGSDGVAAAPTMVEAALAMSAVSALSPGPFPVSGLTVELRLLPVHAPKPPYRLAL